MEEEVLQQIAQPTQPTQATNLPSGVTPAVSSLINTSPQVSGQAVVQAATNPLSSLNFSDPFKARSSISKSIGLDDAVSREQEALSALKSFQSQAQAEQQAIEGNRDLSVGLAQGFQSERRKENALGESNLIDALSLVRNQRNVLENRLAQDLTTFQRELANRRDLVAQALQFGDRDVDVNMSIDELQGRVIRAEEDFKEREEKRLKKEQEEAEKKAERDFLNDIYKQAFGKKPKGLSRRETRRALEKAGVDMRSFEQRMNDLKLEGQRLSNANTRSLISKRSAVPQIDEDTAIAYIDAIERGLPFSQVPTEYRDLIVGEIETFGSTSGGGGRSR